MSAVSCMRLAAPPRWSDPCAVHIDRGGYVKHGVPRLWNPIACRFNAKLWATYTTCYDPPDYEYETCERGRMCEARQ